MSVMPIKTWEKWASRGARSNSNESPTGRRQSSSNLRSRKNTNNGSPHERTGYLDELPGGREFGRRRPIYLGQRFLHEF